MAITGPYHLVADAAQADDVGSAVLWQSVPATVRWQRTARLRSLTTSWHLDDLLIYKYDPSTGAPIGGVGPAEPGYRERILCSMGQWRHIEFPWRVTPTATRLSITSVWTAQHGDVLAGISINDSWGPTQTTNVVTGALRSTTISADVSQHHGQLVSVRLWYRGQIERGGGVLRQGEVFTGASTAGNVVHEWWSDVDYGSSGRYVTRIVNCNGLHPPAMAEVVWPGVAADGYNPPQAITWWDTGYANEYASERMLLRVAANDGRFSGTYDATAYFLGSIQMGVTASLAGSGGRETLKEHTHFGWQTYDIAHLTVNSMAVYEQ